VGVGEEGRAIVTPRSKASPLLSSSAPQSNARARAHKTRALHLPGHPARRRLLARRHGYRSAAIAAINTV
jgi:hypothetical protein